MGVHFEFEFSDYRTEDKAVLYRFPFMGSPDLEKLTAFTSDDSGPFMEAREDLESDYGCHDFFGTMDPENYTVGFSSQEVEKDKHGELMSKWREFFEQNGYRVGAVEFLGEVTDEEG